MFLLRGKSPPRSSLLPQANACYRCLTLPLLLGGRNCLPPKTPSSSLVNSYCSTLRQEDSSVQQKVSFPSMEYTKRKKTEKGLKKNVMPQSTNKECTKDYRHTRRFT